MTFVSLINFVDELLCLMDENLDRKISKDPIIS